MAIEEILSEAVLDHLMRPGVRVSDRLVHILREHIRSGGLPSGTRLPSVREMAKRCQLSPDTIVRTYQRLAHAGDVEAVRGSGYYVRGGPVIQPLSAPAMLGAANEAGDWETLLAFDRPLDRMPGTGLLLMPHDTNDRARNALRSALRTRSDLDLGYGDPQGYLPLRLQLQRKLASEGITCEPGAIITATGATGIMNIVVRALVRPGNHALVEDPGPFLHKALLLSQGAEIGEVPRGPDGPDIPALRAFCEEVRPRIFFCSSLMHNPTGSTISAAVAHQILLLAEEFDMLVVDDTSYADLRPADAPVFWTPLAMLSGLRRVVHVGSFSRMLTPALGVGYLVADDRQLPLLSLFRRIHGVGSNLISERAVYQMLEDGQFERIRRSASRHVALQRRKLIAELCEAGYPANSSAIGPFLWLSLRSAEQADLLHRRLHEERYLTAPARIFTSAPAYASFTRLNVTTTSDRALEIIGRAMP